jgi:hypothetical protein
MFELVNPIEPTGRLPGRQLRWGLCLLLSFAAPVNAAPAGEQFSSTGSPLGTLFYSAAERNAIAKARFGQADEENSISTLVRVSGIVKRVGGKSTVWINGQAVPEGQSQAPTVKTTISGSSVTVDGQRVRVGETLDINTRQRADIVSPGAVTTRDRP